MTASWGDPVVEGLDVYVVGGAVRDKLLGRPPGDRDWVVVGATPEAMAKRGFNPVGGDFPVFLHPKTREEYALARTERKSAPGYKGFVFHAGVDVTLEEDLLRRDFTVNAMAEGPDGKRIDPFGGEQDLAARQFRHVGPAFVEDPVRILRLGRFLARFSDFHVHPDTLALCREMVANGEVDALVAERVWRELARGLMAERPSHMLRLLDDTGVLGRVLPEWLPLVERPAQLDAAAQAALPLAGRYALACLGVADTTALSRRLRAPVECADAARLLPRVLEQVQAETPDAVLTLLEQVDALRKPERFALLLATAAVCGPVPEARWQGWLAQVRAVDAGAVAQACANEPQRIRAAVREARLVALAG